MSTLTVAEFKEKLKSRNLSTAGTKIELVKRLTEAGVLTEELQVTGYASGEEYEMQPDEPQQRTSAQTTVSALREIELLRRERDLTAHEAELLRRELELLKMSARPEEDALVRASVKKWQELKDLVGKFNGNNLDFDR
ncbi:unnamed protein product [Lasius platythorax]|uniref:SAP domain-containing protein n=1 Tax=Lasius platythorax TaxID=488582 RepID=A0AAV2MXS4_9HYME